MNSRSWMIAAGLLLLGNSSVQAGEPERRPRSAAELARSIDRHIATGWTAKQVQPAPLADDAEFARRLHLDLTGRIPQVQDLRGFLDDPAAERRAKLITRLLRTPLYAEHMTTVWRVQMLRADFQAPQFESWLRDRLRDNVGYDRIVRDILTTPLTLSGGPGAVAYYQANQFLPEELAASTSRAFLGVRLECAQCHNHPFQSWKRQQFWEYAVFFAGVQPGKAARRDLMIPGTETTVQARFLNGDAPEAKSDRDPRTLLADWMTRPENPYFARTAVNRVWAQFFGSGLIDPVEDPGEDSTPSHPALLDELATEFAAHAFDLQYLIEAIARSETYQRTSRQTHVSQQDARAFGRMVVRGLTAEQLYDSLAVATGHRGPRDATAAAARALFLRQFASPERATEQQTSILQALALMNGKLVADATSLERSEVLAAVVTSPFLDTAGKLEALYLATLGRKPRAEEVRRLSAYVDQGGARNDAASAFSDIYWALLNSTEFSVNH